MSAWSPHCFGVWAGSLLVIKWGMGKSLLLTGVLQPLSNLMLSWQAHVGHDIQWPYATIAIENFTGGMGSAALSPTSRGSAICIHRDAVCAVFVSGAWSGARSSRHPWAESPKRLDGSTTSCCRRSWPFLGMLLLIFMLRRHPVTIETPAANIADD